MRIATIGLCMLLLAGCVSNAEEVQQQQLEAATERPKQADRLFDAVVQEFGSRDWKIRVSSREHLLNATHFEELNSELRRRVIARVMVFPRGLALNVTSEYQRLDRSTKPPQWIGAEDEMTLSRARRDEAELGKAIQARFKERP